MVERADRRIVAIEVKLSSSIDTKHVKHLNWLQQTPGDRVLDRLVVHTGPLAYRRPDGVGVVAPSLVGVVMVGRAHEFHESVLINLGNVAPSTALAPPGRGGVAVTAAR